MTTINNITDHTVFVTERNRENGRNWYRDHKHLKIQCDVCGSCFKLPYLYRHRKTKRHLKKLEKLNEC